MAGEAAEKKWRSKKILYPTIFFLKQNFIYPAIEYTHLHTNSEMKRTETQTLGMWWNLICRELSS